MVGGHSMIAPKQENLKQFVDKMSGRQHTFWPVLCHLTLLNTDNSDLHISLVLLVYVNILDKCLEGVLGAGVCCLDFW